ncbi:hypothetical protein DPMN_124156 [Dreissena polymorpha]|uniref:Uncharacterized protein n=1 Tax=Dreissena polymorpha TaxID=45954 RepID=A0A9D4JVW9_DREPO|nr:hypothetical protein DPMN_124156 [Dreissena polymorpha]
MTALCSPIQSAAFAVGVNYACPNCNQSCCILKDYVLKRKLYNFRTSRDSKVPNVPPATNNDDQADPAIKSLKKVKSAGVDKHMGKLLQSAGKQMIADYVSMCNKI